MRLLVLLLAAAAVQTAAFAQDVKPAYKGNPPFDIKNSQIGNPTSAPPSRAPLAGTAPIAYYLFPDWTRGVLRPYSGPSSRVWLKYNVMDHQLIKRSFLGETPLVTVVNTDDLHEFSVGDSARGLRLTFRRYLTARVPKANLRTTFFEVHYDAGKTALLCKRLASPNRDDVLRYYLKTADNLLTPLDLAPRPVLAALGPLHADALVAFARDKQLNLTREADVVRLLLYHDSL